MTAMIQDFKSRGLLPSSSDSFVLLWTFFFRIVGFKFFVVIAALPLATLYS